MKETLNINNITTVDDAKLQTSPVHQVLLKYSYWWFSRCYFKYWYYLY
ncbi:MAG: hypothetical protein ACLR43_08110 [Faecalibacillus faecis]